MMVESQSIRNRIFILPPPYQTTGMLLNFRFPLFSFSALSPFFESGIMQSTKNPQTPVEEPAEPETVSQKNRPEAEI